MTALDPRPAPTTADLLDRLHVQAEDARRSIDRTLTALNDNRCPDCDWPLETSPAWEPCPECGW